VFVYGVVSARTEEALELFIRREDAERFLAEVRADEPALAELLSVEPIELGADQSAGPLRQ
jgi:Tic22-like family protein